jgi:hypothetical protein
LYLSSDPDIHWGQLREWTPAAIALNGITPSKLPTRGILILTWRCNRSDCVIGWVVGDADVREAGEGRGAGQVPEHLDSLCVLGEGAMSNVHNSFVDLKMKKEINGPSCFIGSSIGVFEKILFFYSGIEEECHERGVPKLSWHGR